jgi:membrane-associated phospholipid phosphatase
MKYFFVFLTLYSISLSAQNADIDILKSINLNRNKKFDNTFIGISNSVAPISIAIPISVLATGLIKHDSTIKNKGIYIGASIAVAAGITTGLKYAVNRTRPFVTYPIIEKGMSAGSPSFPSGHTSDAFSTATSVSLAFPKWYVIAPSFLWACSVGYSRMDLGVHYPTDVLCGAIIGSGTSYLCYKANKWLYKRKRK